MNVILLKELISDKEREQLMQEFPQFQILISEESGEFCKDNGRCSLVEIVYGDRLTVKEFKTMSQLRWVHVPNPYVELLCIDEIEATGKILVTTSKEESITQIIEFAMSGVYAFSKNLFHWFQANPHDIAVHGDFWMSSMWQTRDKIFLQIGLGTVGSQMAARAKKIGFKVWGVQDPPSFHPHCHKVIPQKELHSVLPAVDVVCVMPPRDEKPVQWIGKRELELLKEDAVLLSIGLKTSVDMTALERESLHPKLRGVVIDARGAEKYNPKSVLWKLPHVMITPGIASLPKTQTGKGFKTFLHNLRQFVHGNFSDMQNLVYPKSKEK
jgi:phosphoglycerate dehydrogenase-like enzyme